MVSVCPIAYNFRVGYCPSCGLAVPGGRSGCQAVFDRMLEREFSDYRYFRVHRMNVDSYSLQHPDEYCASAKSFMAHLGGLCCVIEFGSDPDMLRALHSSLNGNLELQRPQPPDSRGALTVARLEGIDDVEAYVEGAQRWAESVWAAYAPLHDVAREWLRRLLHRRADPLSGGRLSTVRNSVPGTMK